MPASIGVNLRVTGHCRQGGRKYMEDFFSVAYQQTEDEKDLEYAFCGIFDGHGGADAAIFAREHLMEAIVKHRGFWSDDDEEVLQSIKDGFMHTHLSMWKIHGQWPKTASGLPSTAGTTASVAFIRRRKIYIGHVGDSGITLGYQEPGCPDWKAKQLTKDHKPESDVEMKRIEQSGGKVVSKSGVPRVVWNRPRIGHKGPIRRSTPIDEIPFLAVARSLGDLWSYNSALNEFVVSPIPDVAVIPIDTSTFRCLIFGTDGLYNMLSPQMAVHIVQQAEKHSEQSVLSDTPTKVWINPSKCLVEKALERWSNTKMRADNTSVITLMLDPPGPPRAEVLRKQKNQNYSSSGLQIETRYQEPTPIVEPPLAPFPPEPLTPAYDNPTEPDPAPEATLLDLDKNFLVKARDSLSLDVRAETSTETVTYKNENDIQINEVSSSSFDYVEEETTVKKTETRKIMLRSSKKEECSSSAEVEESTVQQQSECRILRERKVCNTIQKKKSLNFKNKINLSMEKKRILQNVLFRQNNANKNWEEKNASKSITPTKCEDGTATKEISRVLRFSNRLTTTTSTSSTSSNKKKECSPNTTATGSKKKSTRGNLIKSSLAQKMFKAKLRGRSITGKLTRDAKRSRNSLKRS